MAHPLVFALVLLGCSDDGAACQKLDAPVQMFASIQQCKRSYDMILGSPAAMHADYPSVEARCDARKTVSSVSQAKNASAQPG